MGQKKKGEVGYRLTNGETPMLLQTPATKTFIQVNNTTSEEEKLLAAAYFFIVACYMHYSPSFVGMIP